MMSEHIPDFFLEQYRLGDAPEEIAARIEGDEEAQARLAAMEAEDADIFRSYPPGWFADRVRERAEHEGIGAADMSQSNAVGRVVARGRSGVRDLVRTVRLSVAIPVVALAVAAAVVVPRLMTETDLGNTVSGPAETDALARGERLKGLEPQVFVYRDVGGDRIEDVSDGSTSGPGDRLQIAYRAAGARYGVIFSVDGNGTVTRHFPETPGGSSALIQDGRIALPFAYVLDDAPAFEVFFFVASSEPMQVAPFFTELPGQIGRAIDRSTETTEVLAAVTSVVEAFAGQQSDGEVVVDTVRTYKVSDR